MNAGLRSVLDDHWARLEAEPVSGIRRLRTSDLPVSVTNGPLVAAVDHTGCRHLLVPLPAGRHLRRTITGTALELRERPLESDDEYVRYADLGCLRKELDEIFTGLCTDVMGTIDKHPDRPVRALHTVLDRWRSLFRSAGNVLGPEQVAGLFGELIILNRLLRLDAGAATAWTGPSGHRHDFTLGTHAIETKASTATEGRRARIHGADQLTAPTGGTLDLVWVRLERAESGDSIVDLIDEAHELADDPADLLTRLALAGYRAADSDMYREMRFAVTEELWYEVDERFPRVEQAALPAAVLDVHYTIELSGLETSMTNDAAVLRRLANMLEECE